MNNILSSILILYLLFISSDTVAQMNQEDKILATGLLSESMLTIEHTIVSLSEEELRYKPRDGGWNATECLEHLYLSEKMFHQKMEKLLTDQKQEALNKKEPDWLVMAKVLDRSNKSVTSNLLTPKNDNDLLSPLDILNEIKSLRSKTIDLLNTAKVDPRQLTTSYPYGKIDGLQQALVIGCHMLRHNLQINEIIQEFEDSKTAQLFEEGNISVQGQHDDYISLNKEENLLVFTRFTDDYRFGTIYYSKLENGRWSAPDVAPFSGEYNDSRPFISPDGNRIYFASNRPTPERPDKRDLDIWYVEYENENWSSPKHTGNIINTEANETHPSVAKNGNLYFARWSREVNDIFVSRIKNGEYTTPIAQPMINTSHSESHPYIDPEERFLLYGSARDEEGMNGEVYITLNLDGAWTEPKKLDLLNSDLYDYSAKLNYEGNRIYFSRTDFKKPGVPADIYYIESENSDGFFPYFLRLFKEYGSDNR